MCVLRAPAAHRSRSGGWLMLSRLTLPCNMAGRVLLSRTTGADLTGAVTLDGFDVIMLGATGLYFDTGAGAALAAPLVIRGMSGGGAGGFDMIRPEPIGLGL